MGSIGRSPESAVRGGCPLGRYTWGCPPITQHAVPSGWGSAAGGYLVGSRNQPGCPIGERERGFRVVSGAALGSSRWGSGSSHFRQWGQSGRGPVRARARTSRGYRRGTTARGSWEVAAVACEEEAGGFTLRRSSCGGFGGPTDVQVVRWPPFREVRRRGRLKGARGELWKGDGWALLCEQGGGLGSVETEEERVRERSVLREGERQGG